VVANGALESNHVAWRGGSTSPPPSRPGTPTGPVSPTQRTQPTPVKKPIEPEKCEQFSGTYIPNSGVVAYSLYDHYIWGNGEQAVIDWSFFGQNEEFVTHAKSLTVGELDDKNLFSASATTDLFLSLGTFTVVRTSERCYKIVDSYDFSPDKAANAIFYLPQWLYQLSGARRFAVRSSGTL